MESNETMHYTKVTWLQLNSKQQNLAGFPFVVFSKFPCNALGNVCFMSFMSGQDYSVCFSPLTTDVSVSPIQ